MKLDESEQESCCSRAMTVAGGGQTEDGQGDLLSSKADGQGQKAGDRRIRAGQNIRMAFERGLEGSWMG